MTEQSDRIISNEEDAAKVKADVRTDAPAEWRHHVAASPSLAVFIANNPPRQHAGEAVFSVRDDGMVDMFLFF